MQPKLLYTTDKQLNENFQLQFQLQELELLVLNRE